MNKINNCATSVSNLPVFPLPVFILPGGKMRLRIFEARYLKMIGIASSSQGFVITSSMTSSEGTSNMSSNEGESHKQFTWGSLVTIEDFAQGHDGILEVDVSCTALVRLRNVTIDKDSLHFADTEVFAHWSEQAREDSFVRQSLAPTLADIISRDAMLSSLYTEQISDEPAWVIARWLELLPVAASVKSNFVVEQSFEQAKVFVKSIVYK